MNLPSDFILRTRELLGDAEFAALTEALEKDTPVSIRMNTDKSDLVPQESTSVPWCREGYYLSGRPSFTFDPLFHAGCYYVQEASSMFLEQALRQYVHEPVTMLDLCAAPGGKSTLARSVLPEGSLLVANEVMRNRSQVLAENLIKWGNPGVIVTNNDPADFTELGPLFDVILTDVPCSGEGMFRKDETAVTEWSPENVRRCAGRQQEILENAAMMLKPGGRLVYSTCTFAPEEDEQAIGCFLEAHPEFALEETPDYPGLSHGVPAWGAGVTDGIEKTVRIWPHRTEGEGHYAALLRKTGEPESVKRKYPASMKDKKLLAVYEDFCKEIFIEPKKWTADSTMTMFGDQLYRTPEEMVDFKGLRVLRPGLQMGEFKKNRFEPSHALALALHPSEVKQNVNLSADAPETAAYLRGETIQLSEEDVGKGWCLVSVDGYSLGWGKKSGGTLKNHYPKGLRKQY